MTFAIRTAAQPASMATAMRGVLREVDRNQPPQSITTMTDLVATTIAEPQFQTRLIAILSMLALLLAAIGVYGVLACAVAERTREIGIRMALGAEKSDITRMVLRRSLLLVTVGVVTRSSRRFGRHSRPRKVPIRSEAHRPSYVPCGSRVTRGCRAPRRLAACATRHQSGSSYRFEVGIVLAPRPKARANRRHNGLSRQQRLDYRPNRFRVRRAIQPTKRCSMKRKSRWRCDPAARPVPETSPLVFARRSGPPIWCSANRATGPSH